MEEVNWLNLPEGVVFDIAKRLIDIVDFVKFGAVCKPWQSITVNLGTMNALSFTPWLMLPETENYTTQEEEPDYNRKFFDLSTGKTFTLYLPETCRRRCFGSPSGWLFTIGLDLKIHLLNPLTRSQFSLPSQPTFQYQYNYKDSVVEPKALRKIFVSNFALSSNTPQSEHGCIVMVIYSQYRQLAFASLGDEAWTAIESPLEAHKDVIFFNGRFYALGTKGMLRICETNKTHPEAIDFMPPPEDVQPWERFYLVEMSGDLHFVVRISGEDENAPEGVFRYEARCFDVYKLDFHSKTWIELFDLGDYALFVGTNTSFSISTLDHPELKRNSIYFTDDREECYGEGNDGGGRDMGIFDFEKETFEPFYSGDDTLSSFCPPLFFVPSLE